ncbi:Thoeris anti-defense Tad2 family protein [Xenorhabdus indica]|uniref:Thoeris anti-defense Tad2 family protein n=1 Tax=Xenorhabdus indica TaxID=333964 RepID=UPI001656AE9F|nr:MW1434 family type I TA system toxin [Xenorhabdus indica]MBC8946937.1 hypothetical protein [Xenorhabdus indica]
MSDVNKPDNTDRKCPFDPNQYNIGDNNITVPAGTSAWALSLVYLGKQVHRSGWNAPIEHMRLAHKSEAGNTDDGDAYIEKSDKDGYWSRWTPRQDDLLACDWALLESESKPECSEDTMISFHLTLGTGELEDVGQSWGYMTEKGHFDSSDAIFGTLSDFQSNINITNIVSFIFYGDTITLKVSSNTDDSDKMLEFIAKNLHVTVDNKTYILHFMMTEHPTDSDIYRVDYSPSDGDEIKLGEVLKQTNKTKYFCFRWV